MKNIEEILGSILLLHPDFSLKIGRKGGVFVVEAKIDGGKPATAMGRDLAPTIAQVHAEAVRLLSEKILGESRLSEAVFDNAIENMESAPKPCCGCSGCCSYVEEEDEEEEDYYEDDEDYDY